MAVCHTNVILHSLQDPTNEQWIDMTTEATASCEQAWCGGEIAATYQVRSSESYSFFLPQSFSCRLSLCFFLSLQVGSRQYLADLLAFKQHTLVNGVLMWWYYPIRPGLKKKTPSDPKISLLGPCTHIFTHPHQHNTPTQPPDFSTALLTGASQCSRRLSERWSCRTEAWAFLP